MSISLTIEDLAASYGARVVWTGVTLTLTRGETLVVSGANGSGKSTLLRMLAGLQSPLQGRISYEIDGHTLTPREATPSIGWVAPDLALYRELTARENLHFFASVRGLRRDDTAIDALLSRIGLAGRADDLVSVYSSGMTQRLRYAYALLHAPAILLLDEPTVTLDQRGAAVVAEVIASQRQHGIVVIATNDPSELRFGDYILTLER